MHVIVLTNFSVAHWKILVIIIVITCVCLSNSAYLSTQCIVFKKSCLWQLRQRGWHELPSVICYKQLFGLPRFAVFLFEGVLISRPPSLERFSRRLTQRCKKHSVCPGLCELQWYTPVEFKRSRSFAVGSYSYFVVMRGAQSHGNKPAAVGLSMLRPLE